MNHLLKLTFLLLAILLPATAFAHAFEVDGIYYNVNGNKATVTYRGSYSDSYSNEYNGDVNIPSSVTYGGRTYTVTSIDYDAFYDCSGLTSVTIPNTVISIGGYAFNDCSGLTSVTIPNSVTTIAEGTFDGCSGLTSVTIPNSVITIGNYAFYGCSSLMSVIIPNSVITIGNYAFYGCSSLMSVIIPNSVITIGDAAFFSCSNLTSVTIPNNVTFLGDYAFGICSKLNTVIWDAVNCTSIGNKAFYNSLSFLQFGDGVEHIPLGMPSLSMSNKNLVLPNSVKTIASGAFTGSCSSVVIGNNIESIGVGAFSSDISVAYVTALSPQPCEENAFANPQTLYVPEGKKMKYFTSQGWGEFNNIIEETYVRASSIVLNKSTVTMIKGNTQQLNATILPTDATDTTVTWLSLNPTVATVSSNGEITAVAVGETDIVAMVDNVRTICHVIVSPVLVESLILSDTQLTLEPNDLYTITATVLPATADYQTLEWIIPDNDVIVTQVVNNTRLNIGAVSSGSVTISVRTTDGSNLSASCTINVQVVSTSISLNMANADLSEGYTMQLIATVLPDNATNKSVLWTTSNSSVATVDDNGLVTAIASGTANITAATTDGSCLSASCMVTVISGTDFTFHIDDIEELAGSTITIPIELENNYSLGAFMFDFYYPEGFGVKGFTKTDRFTSETTVNGLNHADEHFYRFIATNISTNLIINAGHGPILYLSLEIPDDASGDYEIGLKGVQVVPKGCKVLFLNDISANLTVKRVLATSVQLNQSTVMLYKGESMQLLATVLPEDVTNKAVNWESSDETIAIVDEQGFVTAISVGKATITATTADGTNLSANCEITVKENLSNYSNYLSLDDIELYPSETIIIPVAMTNTDAIVSFQTDIFLPEGLEMVQEEGGYLIDSSDRMTRTHSIISNDVSSGAVRVMCYSSNYKPFTGNSGDDLFYITVKVADDAVGDYCIFLRNTLLTTSDFEEIVAPEVLANVKVKAYMKGDANGSGTVTVTDVVVTSQYVLEMNPQPFVFQSADVNDDGNITVTDVSRIAWMVLNPTQNAPRRAPVLWNNGDSMSADGITLAVGETRTVSIALDNVMDYSAFQFDMALPEGLTASNFRLTDRADGHAFDVNTLANGNIRALCYSPALTAIHGHEGAVLTFDVTATSAVEGSIKIDGIELVTTDCQTVRLDAFAIGVNSTTSVNEHATGKIIAKVEYFNIAGQRLERPENGVTLIVTTYTDGTRMTQKIIK